jgi:acetyltransferase
MLDVNWGDLVDYFGNDPRTHSIVIYMESIGDARSFLSAAREVSLTKPVIVIKAGRTAAAAKAAASHTGALTGSDEVLDAAFRRTGVLRVNSIADIFFMSDVLAKQPRPRGNRLCIPDQCRRSWRAGHRRPGRRAAASWPSFRRDHEGLRRDSARAMEPQQPGGHPGRRRTRALREVAGDCRQRSQHRRHAGGADAAGHDQPNADRREAEAYAKGLGKPVLASWMGGAEVAAGEQILNQAGIPTFQFPDSAVRAFNYMWRYAYNLKGIYETPVIAQHADAVQRGKPSASFARCANRAHHSDRVRVEAAAEGL